MVRITNIFIIVFVYFLFSLSLISSLPNDAGTSIDFNYPTITNYSLVNTNNSNFLGGYPFSSFYPFSNSTSFASSIWAYNQSDTDPIWLRSGDSIYNTNLGNIQINSEIYSTKRYYSYAPFYNIVPYTYTDPTFLHLQIGDEYGTNPFNMVSDVVDGYITDFYLKLNSMYKFYFGTNSESSIYYDGGNMTINPRESGYGSLKVLGDVYNTGYGIYSDSLNLLSSSSTGSLFTTTTSNTNSISVGTLLAPSGTGDVYFSVGKALHTTLSALIGWSNTGATSNYAFLTTQGRPASDFAIFSTGQVAVGTTKPQARFTINGNLSVLGNATINGTIKGNQLNITNNAYVGNITADTFKGKWNNSGDYVPYTGATKNINIGTKTINGIEIQNDIAQNSIKVLSPISVDDYFQIAMKGIDGDAYFWTVSDAENPIDMHFQTDITGGEIYFEPTSFTSIEGHLKIPLDNKKLYLGTGDDATIYYDGTNMVINPKEVGIGRLNVLGNIQVNGTGNFSGNVNPMFSNTYSLGSTGARWLKGWFSGLDVTGHINQTSGNATINNIYGEIYNKSDTGFETIDLVTQDVYVPVKMLTSTGNINGFSTASGNLTAQVAGLYKATAKVGVLASATSGENGMKIFINEAGQNQCYDHEETSTTTTIGFPIDCLIRLSVGDNVSIRFDDHNNPVGDLNLLNGNLNLLRIGN